jgi:hypothetical protein
VTNFGDERRKFTRIPFSTEVRITSGEKEVFSQHLRDIGFGGTFVVSEDRLDLNASCDLEIKLIGPASLLKIHVQGEVIRVRDDGLAIKFTKIDLDSLLHLRHLIRVITQDPELIDLEFSENVLEIK